MNQTEPDELAQFYTSVQIPPADYTARSFDDSEPSITVVVKVPPIYLCPELGGPVFGPEAASQEHPQRAPAAAAARG